MIFVLLAAATLFFAARGMPSSPMWYTAVLFAPLAVAFAVGGALLTIYVTDAIASHPLVPPEVRNAAATLRAQRHSVEDVHLLETVAVWLFLVTCFAVRRITYAIVDTCRILKAARRADLSRRTHAQ